MGKFCLKRLTAKYEPTSFPPFKLDFEIQRCSFPRGWEWLGLKCSSVTDSAFHMIIYILLLHVDLLS